ncbi:hypothetical protein VYU27_009241 [Nannochloropsis oceanica]
MTFLLPSSRRRRRRSLLETQVDYCLKKGVTLRRLDGKGGAKGNSSCSGGPLQEYYHVSLPYAGTSIELQAVLYMGQGGEIGNENEDEDEEQQEDENESLYLPLPDLIPLSIDSASPSSSSSSSLHDAYTTLAWNTLQLDPACAEWGPEGGREKGREGGWGSTAKGLFELLLAIKRQVTEYHVKNVQGFALEDSVRFELEMMAGLPGLELLTRTTYAGREIHVLLPLWASPSSSSTSSPSLLSDDDKDEDEEEEDDEGRDASNAISQTTDKTPVGGLDAPPPSSSSSSCPPFGRHLQLHLTYSLDPLATTVFTGSNSSSSSGSSSRTTTTSSKVLLRPARTTDPSLALPLTREAVCHSSLPSPSQDDMLILDYLNKVRNLFLVPFLKRQSFIRALMANFTMIEFDACEFASATILLRIHLPRVGRRKKKKKKGKEKDDEGGGEREEKRPDGEEHEEEGGEEEDEEENEEEHSFLLHFTFPWDFPADRSPPEVLFSDVARARDRIRVDRERGEWRYSPRWEGKRMAEALVEHAKAVIAEDYGRMMGFTMAMH